MSWRHGWYLTPMMTLGLLVVGGCPTGEDGGYGGTIPQQGEPGGSIDDIDSGATDDAAEERADVGEESHDTTELDSGGLVHEVDSEEPVGSDAGLGADLDDGTESGMDDAPADVGDLPRPTLYPIEQAREAEISLFWEPNTPEGLFGVEGLVARRAPGGEWEEVGRTWDNTHFDRSLPHCEAPWEYRVRNEREGRSSAWSEVQSAVCGTAGRLEVWLDETSLGVLYGAVVRLTEEDLIEVFLPPDSFETPGRMVWMHVARDAGVGTYSCPDFPRGGVEGMSFRAQPDYEQPTLPAMPADWVEGAIIGCYEPEAGDAIEWTLELTEVGAHVTGSFSATIVGAAERAGEVLRVEASFDSDTWYWY